jgi:hypothetical protein
MPGHGAAFAWSEYCLLWHTLHCLLRLQGFSTAKTQPTVQRIIFRSSMADPVHPLIDRRLAAEEEDSTQQK